MQRRILVTVLALLVTSIAAATRQSPPAPAVPDGPGQDFNPRRAHLRVSLESTPPNLEFYDNTAFSGRPTMRLTVGGFYVADTLVCTWPEGRFDVATSFNMVLGYSADPGRADARYVPCPKELPIVSTWGDGGLGVAALFVEAVGRRGSVLTVIFGGRYHYLNLASLPGRYRWATAAGGAGPPVGWGWSAQAAVYERQARRTRDSVYGESELVVSLRDMRSCLASAALPECLVDHVSTDFYLPESHIEHGVLTPSQVVERLAVTPTSDGQNVVSHLRSCLLTGVPNVIGRNEVELIADEDWRCVLIKAGRWKLSKIFQEDH